MEQSAIVCHLGRVDYHPMWDLQKLVQQRLIEAKRNTEPVPHVIFTVEHPPVFTLGKSGDKSNLLASDVELIDLGATFVHIDRGGDITFHGPGQLVVYPIFDLDKIFTDIGKYLRLLESSVIETCAQWDINTDRFTGRTGVWVEPDSRGPERKICAMGIRASRWVTMHGLALNIGTDLSFFESIIPCGIDDRGVTSMESETGQTVDPSKVTSVLIDRMKTHFELDLVEMNRSESIEFLSSFVGLSTVVRDELQAF